MTNRSGSKSTLFLMEQLIVILIFSICAAVCVKIFVISFIMVSNSSDTVNALRMAQSGAECYKAVSGDIESAAAVLRGSAVSDGLIVYYDDSWRECVESEASYVLTLTDKKEPAIEIAGVQKLPESLKFGNISVSKVTGEELVAFTVAVTGRDVK